METRQEYQTHNGRSVSLKPLDPRLKLFIQAIRRCCGILIDVLKTIEEMH